MPDSTRLRAMSRASGTRGGAMARPFLKWAGGKGQLIPEIRRRVPSQISNYYEPFVGSGAVFFDLAGRRAFRGTAALWDSNAALIGTYRRIRDDLDALVKRLAGYARQHDPRDSAFFYLQRDRYNRAPEGSIEHAALFIYLNRTCFNGLYRVNSRGEFNVPAGSYARPPILDEPNLRAVSCALQGVAIDVRDFRTMEEGLADAPPGSFVYLDPPYQPVNATSNFTSYTADAFGEAEQRELARIYRSLSDRGLRVLLSNSWTPLIHDLYRGFQVDEVLARRAINSVAERRGPVREVLVRNY